MKFLKNIIFAFILILFFTISCRKNNGSTQQINQVVHIYIDSLGKDMLNTKLSGTYTAVSLKDIGGVYDQTAVSYNLKKNTDTVNYIEYVSGAKRNLLDSTSPYLKYYKSDMVLRLTKTVNSVSKTTIDTVEVQYSWTPSLFQVSKIIYNKVSKPITVNGATNTVHIVK